MHIYMLNNTEVLLLNNLFTFFLVSELLSEMSCYLHIFSGNMVFKHQWRTIHHLTFSTIWLPGDGIKVFGCLE